MNEQVEKPRGMLSEIHNHLNAWMGGIFVMLPLLFVWWRMAANGLGGQETTFAFSRDPSGKWMAASELTPLLMPMIYLVLLHIGRFFTVMLTFSSDKTVSEPILSSFSLEYDSRRILLFYGATYALWFVNFNHSGKEQHWPFVTLLVFALASYAMAARKYLYGFKLVQPSPQVMIRSNGENSEQGNAAPLKVARSQPTRIRFIDIYGNADIKRRLLEAGRAITNPRKEGQTARNGILLFGEPGNGKTVFAEALAGELSLPFLQLTHSDVASQWVGERTVRIKAAFDQAIAAQPCVLFIDEIDSFLPDRSNSMTSSNKEDSDVVNTLLTLLVDIRRAQVVVIAATNFMDRLDSAAVREGRFDYKVEITPPDEEARIGLLRSGMKSNVPKSRVSDEIIRNVAQRWNGFSVKRILAVTEEMPSYLSDMEEKGTAIQDISFDDFMATLRRIQGRKGASPENVKSMSELILPARTREELNMIASRLADPVRVERLGGTLPTGVLFYGPPGTGKTVACKALAKEVGSAFLTSTGADLARDPKALEKLFAQAKELRPAIIFIDEADDLLRSREYSANTEATNKLLALMDGINDRVRDVVWVAATNNPDQIDSALLRGGRFTEKVEFIRPESKQLSDHIQGWLAKRKISLAAGLTAENIGILMDDQSIANAEAVLQHAVNRAISQTNGDVIEVSLDDVKVGLSTVLGTT